MRHDVDFNLGQILPVPNNTRVRPTRRTKHTPVEHVDVPHRRNSTQTTVEKMCLTFGLVFYENGGEDVHIALIITEC